MRGDGDNGGGCLTFFIKKFSKFQIFKRSGRVGKDIILQVFLEALDDLGSVSSGFFSEKTPLLDTVISFTTIDSSKNR